MNACRPVREKLLGYEVDSAGEAGSFCRGNWNLAGGRNNLGARPNIFGRTPKYLGSVALIPNCCFLSLFISYVMVCGTLFKASQTGILALAEVVQK